MSDKERFTKEIQEYWAYEHLHRYYFASQFVGKKVVLDIASGDGYGSEILSRNALKVFGVDISENTILNAQQSYKKDNLEFFVGDVLDIPVKDNSVDIITCFETLEHVDEHEKVFQEFKRVLKNNGLLIISSPNKKYYSDESGYQNPYHKKELYKNEFEELIQNHFKYTYLYKQSTVLASFISSDKSSELNQYFEGDFNEARQNSNFNIDPIFLIGICTDVPLLSNVTNSIFQFSKVLNGMKLPNLIYEFSQLNERISRLNKPRFKRLLQTFKKIVFRH
jgi:ubiquinone/menaquinone biosynthesis C-methylase UbiE